MLCVFELGGLADSELQTHLSIVVLCGAARSVWFHSGLIKSCKFWTITSTSRQGSVVTCYCLCTVEFVDIIKLLDCNFEPIIIYFISIRFGFDFSIVSSAKSWTFYCVFLFSRSFCRFWAFIACVCDDFAAIFNRLFTNVNRICGYAQAMHLAILSVNACSSYKNCSRRIYLHE